MCKGVSDQRLKCNQRNCPSVVNFPSMSDLRAIECANSINSTSQKLPKQPDWIPYEYSERMFIFYNNVINNLL